VGGKEEAVSSVLYKPFGLLFSVLGGVLAGAIFNQIWKQISGEEAAPDPTNREYGWREVLTAAAIHGAVFGVVKAAIDRGGAHGFRKVTGVWPGK
jgi:Protein of unknown function (DUF4235)